MLVPTMRMLHLSGGGAPVPDKFFHLDETSSVTLSGSDLATITDNEGGIVFTATGTPARTGVTVNGIQCIADFDGSTEYVSTATQIDTATDRVRHFVFASDSTSGSGQYLMDSSAPRSICAHTLSGNGPQHYAGTWSGVASPPPTGLQVLTFEESGGAVNIYRNGSLVHNVPGRAVAAIDGVTYLAGIGYFDGKLCEISMHRPDTGARVAEINRLISKWGI